MGGLFDAQKTPANCLPGALSTRADRALVDRSLRLLATPLSSVYACDGEAGIFMFASNGHDSAAAHRRLHANGALKTGRVHRLGLEVLSPHAVAGTRRRSSG